MNNISQVVFFFLKKFLGKSKDKEDKNKDIRENFSLWQISANSKHNLTPIQMFIKPYTKDILVPQFFLHHVWLTTKKLQDILKGQPHSLKSQNKH